MLGLFFFFLDNNVGLGVLSAYSGEKAMYGSEEEEEEERVRHATLSSGTV